MRARKIPKNRRSVTGKFPSQKLDRLVSYESTLERDLFTLLEFDPNVTDYEEQPVKIDYELLTGRLSRYTPDARAILREHPLSGEPVPPVLIEIKYRKDLQIDLPGLRQRMRAGARFAKQNGWTFRVLTERHIRSPFLDNARLLLGYRRLPTLDRDVIAAMQHIARSRGQIAGDDLVQAIGSAAVDRDTVIRHFWHLLSTFQLQVDLNRPLSMSSIVKPIYA